MFRTGFCPSSGI